MDGGGPFIMPTRAEYERYQYWMEAFGRQPYENKTDLADSDIRYSDR